MFTVLLLGILTHIIVLMLLEEQLGAAVDFPTLLSIKQINIFINLSSWEIMGRIQLL
jgi:hypothetical protein